MSSELNFAKIVKTWQVNDLVGKVMLVVESFGLNENQLEAGKSLIKQFIWSEFNEGIYISEEMTMKNQAALEKEGILNITQ
jgi:hypothetical protein